MDEPFNCFDHNSEQLLESFITHNRLQGIALADDVISLKQGKVTKSPLINLFHGSVNSLLFNTEKIKIMQADNAQVYLHTSIDPDEIVLPVAALVSSM
jgi:tungstate transport system ATP-binding protein